ncbi:phosphatase PAP2 family protein [Methanolapillus ohkumae]|uniref:Phosphatidic acid phosphatase type 2/haloperoxidase domain-containing protein n=1 Tax=Methanolapillus ohkumae TaxID=3028298 RepID=A0AA96V6B2_9EURY|nr:hypothetical protein MsAm2_05020 [Methanosarcinaceae archaeon Am2]
MFEIIQSVDQSVILWIYNWGGTSFLDRLCVFLSYTGTLRLAAILLSVYFFMRKETRKYSYVIVFALLLSNLIVFLLKIYVDRPRPFVELNIPKSDILVYASPYMSFPSGHAASAFSTAVVMIWYFRKWTVPAVALAVIAAAARVYLMVHYPSDVIGGAIIGILFSAAVILIFERYWKVKTQKNSRHLIGEMKNPNDNDLDENNANLENKMEDKIE